GGLHTRGVTPRGRRDAEASSAGRSRLSGGLVYPVSAEERTAGRAAGRAASLQVDASFRYTGRMRIACGRCGPEFSPKPTGRTPRYCKTSCRVAAHRARPQVPAELRSRPRWVRHRDKVPVTVAGRPASATDPATWSTYAAARRSTVGDGIGFVLGDGVACLDLDHCLVDGVPNELAREVLARVPGAYVEVSPSG